MTAFPATWMARSRNPVRLLTIAGAVALLAGSLIYVLWRRPESAVLLPASLQFAFATAPPLTGQLPALLHAYAFTLLTVAVLGASRRHAACAAAGWAALGSLFEAGQLPAIAEGLSGALAGIGGIAGTGALSAYFTGGTFDPLDMCATALGALAAYLTVARVLRKGGTHENQKIIRAI